MASLTAIKQNQKLFHQQASEILHSLPKSGVPMGKFFGMMKSKYGIISTADLGRTSLRSCLFLIRDICGKQVSSSEETWIVPIRTNSPGV